MGFSLRKWFVLSAFASLVVVSACDKHRVGELPEVQKEHSYPENRRAGEPVPSGSQTPSAKPTPADFFPETKPR
jgi:hypothetical protein